MKHSKTSEGLKETDAERAPKKLLDGGAGRRILSRYSVV